MPATTDSPLAALLQPAEGAEANEPLLIPNPKRFVLFPIQYHDIWNAYKNAEANFWSAEEVEMSDDLDGFESLSRKEQSFVMQVVGIMCIGHGISYEDILSRFSDEIQAPEARCFFGFHIMQKNIHMELCTVLLDMFCPSVQQRDDLMDALIELTSHQLRIDWIKRHMTESTDRFSTRIVALAVFEAVLRSTARDVVLYVAGPETAALPPTARDPHPLPGLINAVYRIHDDHQQYVGFAATLKGRLFNQPDTRAVHDMVRDAMNVEYALIDDLFQLSGGTIAINGHTASKTDLMRRAQFTADQCLARLGVPTLYKVQDPLPWIPQLLVREGKKNERNEQMSSTVVPVQNTPSASMIDQAFTLDEDF
ncbi:ferritin-like superfamily [Entophlyctis helioformis]|nr:ferritin-like superfamily [Entophlyctis helioformis]